MFGEDQYSGGAPARAAGACPLAVATSSGGTLPSWLGSGASVGFGWAAWLLAVCREVLPRLSAIGTAVYHPCPL